MIWLSVIIKCCFGGVLVFSVILRKVKHLDLNRSKSVVSELTKYFGYSKSKILFMVQDKTNFKTKNAEYKQRLRPYR